MDGAGTHWWGAELAETFASMNDYERAKAIKRALESALTLALVLGIHEDVPQYFLSQFGLDNKYLMIPIEELISTLTEMMLTAEKVAASA